jgi:hypothetical protein
LKRVARNVSIWRCTDWAGAFGIAPTQQAKQFEMFLVDIHLRDEGQR